MRLKICFVCSEYPPAAHGGIGSVTHTLATQFAAGGHRVRVAGVYAGAPAGGLVENDSGVEVWRLPEDRGPLGWLRTRWKLWRLISGWARKGELDLVEVPDYQGWAAGWGRLPVPVVSRIHGSGVYFAAEMGRQASRVTARLEGWSLSRADFIASCSHYSASRTEALFGLSKPATILYNPVEVPAAGFRQRSSNVVVYSGRLALKKGVVSLARAWRIVHLARPDAELHLFGKEDLAENGSPMKEFLLTQLGPSRRTVHFHGHVRRETVQDALGAARAAVFPSFAEAFAVAPLEAMASGCPTICTSMGSGPELIRDGIDGLLVDPARPGDIAAAIRRLLGDDELAGELGEAGRRRVRSRFSTAILVPANLRFFQGACAAFAARGAAVPLKPAWTAEEGEA